MIEITSVVTPNWPAGSSNSTAGESELLNLGTKDAGGVRQITVKLTDKYVHLTGVNEQFNKKTIRITAPSFVSEIEKIKQEVEKVLSKTKESLVLSSPIYDNGFTASFTKNTEIKNLKTNKPLTVQQVYDTYQSTSYDAYVVLSIPFVYANTTDNKATLPIHIKSIGILTGGSELDNIDPSALSPAT